MRSVLVESQEIIQSLMFKKEKVKLKEGKEKRTPVPSPFDDPYDDLWESEDEQPMVLRSYTEVKQQKVLEDQRRATAYQEKEAALGPYYGRLLFCGCGFKGTPTMKKQMEEEERWQAKAVQLNMDLEPINPEPLQIVKARVARDVALCPECEKEPAHVLNIDDMNARPVFDFVRTYDDRDRNKMSFVLGYSTYFFNRRAGKLSRKNNQFRLTLKTDTGMLYCIWNGRICNVSNGSYPGKQDRLESLLRLENVGEVLRDWMREVLHVRGARYVIPKAPFKHYGYVAEYAPYLRYPILQNLPFHAHRKLPKRIHRVLQKPDVTMREVWEAYIGVSYKSIRKMITGHRALVTFLFISHFFKQPDNLVKLMEGRDDHLLYVQDYAYPENEHVERQLEDNRSTIEFFRPFFQNETHYVNAIRKTKYRHAKHFSLNSALGIMRDVMHMFNNIRQIDPNYNLDFDGNILRLHDRLSRDQEKYRNPNLPISYSEDERRMEMDIDGLSFRLPETTHDLISIGSEMSHCVGGYGDRAYRKGVVIISVIKDGGYYICIEAHLDRRNVLCLNQVKMYENELPERDDALIVKKWAEEVGIDWNCSDMRALGLPQDIVTRQMKLAEAGQREVVHAFDGPFGPF